MSFYKELALRERTFESVGNDYSHARRFAESSKAVEILQTLRAAALLTKLSTVSEYWLTDRNPLPNTYPRLQSVCLERVVGG